MMKRLLTYGALCLCRVGTTALWAETHTVKFFINGVNFHTDSFEEGADIVFPEDDQTINDNLELVGWSTTELAEPQDAVPAYVNSATMGSSDINYYAVFAEPLEYRLTSSLISQMDENQAWDEDAQEWYVVYNRNETNSNLNDTLSWTFKGFRSATYGKDKLCIGKAESGSYIRIAAPHRKTITKVTVGIVSYETEKTTKHSYKGGFYLRTGLNVTTDEIAVGGPSTLVDNPLELTTIVNRGDYYLQTDNLARIYAVKVTCGLTGYRTTLYSDTVKIGDSGYGTLCLPWHAAVPEGVTAYRLKEVDLSKTSHQLRFAEVAGMIAGQGYLIKGTPGESYIFRRVYSEPEDASLTNLMVGVTVRTDMWALYKGDPKPFILTKNACFMQYTGQFMPAFKAYVVVDPSLIQYAGGESSAAELRVTLEEFDNYVTGLSEAGIETRNEAPVVYDLTGKQVPQVKRGGLYIVNGKTVLVK